MDDKCPYCSGDETWGSDGLYLELRSDSYANASIECVMSIGKTMRFVNELDHFNYCPNCGRELKGER